MSLGPQPPQTASEKLPSPYETPRSNRACTGRGKNVEITQPSPRGEVGMVISMQYGRLLLDCKREVGRMGVWTTIGQKKIRDERTKVVKIRH